MSIPAIIILGDANLPKATAKYCMECTSKLFHINRAVLVVYPGGAYPEKEIPKGMGLVQIKCRGRVRDTGEPCPMLWNFYFQ